MAVAKRQPTRWSATARGRSTPAPRVAIRRLPCGVARAASASAGLRMAAWTSGTTWNRAGTWGAACPRRQSSAPGGLLTVPPDGTISRRRATAGQGGGIACRHVIRAASSGTVLTGAPRRPAFGTLQSTLVGVQPTIAFGPRPSGPGKAAAFSRIALPLRRASVVSTASGSERVETTPRNDARRNRNRFNKGGLWTSDSAQTAFRGSNARKSPPGIAKYELFSPESQGHQAVGSGRVIPHEPLAG